MKFRFRGNEGEGEASLGEEGLEVRPRQGAVLAVPYVDIDSARAADYRIHLTVRPGEPLELYFFGTRYEAFCEELFEKRNASLARELFLADRRRIATFKGRFEWPGAQPAEGRIDLYPRTLVFFPRWEDPFFLRIADLDTVRAERQHYRVVIQGEPTVTVSFLGLRLEEFHERVTRVRQAMERRCGRLLEQLVPGAGVLAPRLLDGRVTPRSAVGDPLWEKLEGLLCGSEARAAAYRHLSTKATNEPWIGLKEIGGDDLDELSEEPAPGVQHLAWYYIPVGELTVHEVVSEEDHATYVYRAPVARINRAWALVQFRRDVLLNPDRYPAAYRKLPYLREVAGALVGRAIHNETWTTQVDRLLEVSSLPGC